MFSRFFRDIRSKNKENGFMTVEVTLVFSVVFFATLMVLFIGMVLYQQVRLQSLAVETSERGAVIYASRVEDMKTGFKTLSDFENRDPYRYLPFMDNGKKQQYTDQMNAYVSSRVGTNNVLSGGVDEGQFVTVDDYIIAKRIKVNIKADYTMPVDGIAQMFGSEGAFHIDTTAMSAVTDPVEFMRNTDLCVDAIKTTDAFDKAQELMQKAQKYIEEFNDLLK